MYFTKPDRQFRLSDSLADGEPSTFMERTVAAYEAGLVRDRANSEQFNLSDTIEARNKAIKDATGVELYNPMNRGGSTGAEMGVVDTTDWFAEYEAERKRLAQKHPDKANIIQADKPIRIEDRERYTATVEKEEKTRNNYSGATGTGVVADFAGGMAAVARDPVQLPGFLVGPGGPVRQTMRSIIGMGLKQALVNAGTQAGIEPIIQNYRKRMGDTYGFMDAASNVAMAGAFGFGADVGGRLLYRGVQGSLGRSAVLDQSGGVVGYEGQAAAAVRAEREARADEIKKNLEALAPDIPERAAAGDVDAQIELLRALKADEDDPALRGTINELTLTDRIDIGIEDGSAERALAQQWRAWTDPNEPAPARVEIARKADAPDLNDFADLPKGTDGNQHYRNFEMGGKPVRFEAIEAKNLVTDPETFQFKGGRDAQGASGKLNAVTFDGTLKGKVIVFERADGTLVVADGHDRVSLAQRSGGDTQFEGFVFREKDGWTADEVRAQAAKKNIQEGTGDLMDTAGAFRRHPEIVDNQLSLGTDFIAQARAIARLSDEAFAAIGSGRYEPSRGELVGDLVPDTAMHMEVLRELDRLNPATETEARKIIADMIRKPVEVDSTLRMLGGSTAEPHVLEARTDVLAGVIGTLRGEPGYIGDVETQAVAKVITRLAERPGLVSDTLNQAGRAVATGQPLERAIDATLRRFEDVIARAGVRGLADRPVVLAAESPLRLAALAGSDAAVGRSMRADLDALGYYSKALEAAKNLKQAKGTPEQMLAQLKAAGVKPAELDATNVAQFLDGKKTVTRDELVKHLTENRVELKQVKGGTAPSRIDQGDVMDWPTRDADRPAKFSNYSLDPSNPTYRETVLHLPPPYEMTKGANGETVIKRDPRAPAESFTSGHFSEPNIIGHMMTSLNKHEGKPVYTLDQIQSDWGQKLRDGGVRDEKKIADLQQRIKDMEDKWRSDADLQRIDAEARALAAEAYPDNWLPANARTRLPERKSGNQWEALQSLADDSSKPIELRERASDLRSQRYSGNSMYEPTLNMLRAELRTAEAATPGNPLVNTTDQWVNTTLRRAIRQAVEADAEFIAIPSGDTVLSYNLGDTGGMRGFYGDLRAQDIVKAEAERGKAELDAEIKSGRQLSSAYLRELEGKVKEQPQSARKGIVPKNLRDLLEKFDKEAAKPTLVDKIETPTKGMAGSGFTLFPLTEKVKRSIMEEGQPLFAKPATDITPAKLNDFAENLRQALDEATTPPPGRLDDPIKDAPLQVERLKEDLAEEIAVAMGQPSAAQLAAIRAYHGSPHDFDRFDLSKIGTGEGAQAYGHGLYFAENEGVARSYRDQLGNYDNAVKWKGAEPPTEMQKSVMDRMSGFDVARGEAASLDSVEREIISGIVREQLNEGNIGWDAARSARRVAKLNQELEALRGMKDLVEVQPPGRLYEVNIKANPEDFLDWDKPLSQQPPKVMDAFKAVGRGDLLDEVNPYTARDALEKLGTRRLTDGQPSHEMMNEASAALREAGIPGIKYLDQGSRGAGEGSRNYVVFDDSLVEIVAKDGKPITPEEKKNILADMRRQQAEERAAKQQAEQPQQQAQPSPLLDLYQRYVTQGREALDAVMPGTGRMIDEFVQANPEVVSRIAEALGAPTGRPQAAQMLEQAMPQFMSPRIIDMSKPVLLTPEANARMREIRSAIDETVKMLPPEYRIRVEDSLVFNFGDGDKRLDGLHDGYEKLIYVSMAAGDPVRTSRHEVIHALRQSGLMKDEEFTALYKFADRLGLRKAYEIDAQYKEPYATAYGNRGADYVEQLLREETVANMFSDYSLNGRRFGDVAGGGMVDRMIDMIVQFMAKVREIMGGYGFRNVYDVFDSIESGAMAQRGMRQMEGGNLASVRQPLDMSPEARKARAEQMGFDTSTVYYHATRSTQQFDSFEIGRRSLNANIMGAQPVRRYAVFVTPEKEFANKFADGGDGSDQMAVLPVFIRPGKTFDATSGFGALGDAFFKRNGLNAELYTLLDGKTAWQAFDDIDGMLFRGALVREGYGSVRLVEDAVDEGITAAKFDRTNARFYLDRHDGDVAAASAEVRDDMKNAANENMRAAYGRVLKIISSPLETKKAPATSLAILDPSNIRSVNAEFDPAQSGSAKLLASMQPNRLQSLSEALAPIIARATQSIQVERGADGTINRVAKGGKQYAIERDANGRVSTLKELPDETRAALSKALTDTLGDMMPTERIARLTDDMMQAMTRGDQNTVSKLAADAVNQATPARAPETEFALDLMDVQQTRDAAELVSVCKA